MGEAFTEKLDAIKDWWTKPAKFNYGDEEHELAVEEENGKPEVYVHSDRSRLKVFLKDHNATPTRRKRRCSWRRD